MVTVSVDREESGEERSTVINQIASQILYNYSRVPNVENTMRPTVEEILQAAQEADVNQLRGRVSKPEGRVPLSDTQMEAARLLAEFYFRIQGLLKEESKERGAMTFEALVIYSWGGMKAIAAEIAGEWFDAGLPNPNSSVIQDVIVLISQEYGLRSL